MDPKIAALTIFVCLMIGIAALGQQPEGLNPIVYRGCTELGSLSAPTELKTPRAQDMRPAQFHGCYTDRSEPMQVISGDQPYGLYIDPHG